ncbi:hypothetical protein CRYUN_Cryun14cG0056400 [Craigia yunnanensis]
MAARSFIVDFTTITSLLIGFHKQGRWDWTERLMKHIHDGNLVPNVLKWKANVEALMQNPPKSRKDYTPLFPPKGDFKEIMNLPGYAGQTMGTNIDFEDCDEKDQVMRQRVQEKGIGTFDVDMVNTFLSIFLAKGKLSLSCKLFEIFTDMGVEPVSYTNNSIMSSFVKKGYINEAWGILNEMDAKICPANIANYNLIIQGLGKMGRADIASSVLDKLMKQGGYIDIVMYNTLINALGKAGRIDEANKFFEQTRTSGINPDVYRSSYQGRSTKGNIQNFKNDVGCRLFSEPCDR